MASEWRQQLGLMFSLWHALKPRRRRQVFMLLGLIVVGSIAEIVSIGAVLPFLTVLTVPDQMVANPNFAYIINWLGLTSPDDLLLHFTLLFAGATLFSGAVRICLAWASSRISFAAGSDLSNEIYLRTLYQPYAVHVSRNSSEVVASIANKISDVMYNVMTPALNLISAMFMLTAILVALLAVSASVALAAFAGFGAIYLVVIRLTRRQVARNSRAIADESVVVIKSLQEGLGGIRDVLIDGTQEVYSSIYRKADRSMRRAQGSNQFLGIFPRYGVETLGMLLIAGLAYAMSQQESGIASAAPVLGTLALGAQRLLPILQQAYGSWTSIRGGHASLVDVLELLGQPMPDISHDQAGTKMPFATAISLRNVTFRYSEQGEPVLKNLNLVLPKGSRIGFIGMTGSGKSTLLDIIMGLLEPTSGTVAIDDVALDRNNARQWQKRLAHVPQSIYLSDATIQENIAFGIPRDQINQATVEAAAQQAQIAQTVEGWPQKYGTRVGERGAMLSGGQRQRIGIARALYKSADVIVFDEATSALDSETESAVMRALEALDDDLTILVIAHRLSTLKNCDLIVELEAGNIKRTGTFKDMISPEFQAK